MPVRFFRHAQPARWTAVVAGSALLLGAAACGSDSTVDNADAPSSSEVPSVSSSPEGDATDQPNASESKDAGKASSSSASNSAAPGSSNGGSSEKDGGVQKVDEVPAGASRSQEDKDYLTDLENQGLDLEKVEGAKDPGGLEDQLIAAAREHCNTGGKNPVIPLTAGQLQSQGIIGKNPGDVEKAQKAMTDAATARYCK